MRIAFITSNYPSTARPSHGTFVQQFVWAMARQGNFCTVINPTSFFDRRYGPYPGVYSREKTGGCASVEVYRPRYLSFSSRNLGFTHTGRWTQMSWKMAVARIFHRYDITADIIYGHFLYFSGYVAVLLAKEMEVPSIIGVGEGEFWSISHVGVKRAKKELTAATAFLANSTHLEKKLLDELDVSPAKIRVFPNGIDSDLFYSRDRLSMCQKYGISPEAFIVVFVGHFSEKKGFPQLLSAVQELNNVQLVLLGCDTCPISSDKVAFCGAVPQDVLAEIICSGHIFVLPTTIEGSCNAAIEAMACGLPIVTSKGEHMDDVVDNSIAIRVDPQNVSQIQCAIQTLRGDPQRRQRMSEACCEKAKRFDINQRARRVTAWFTELVGRGQI